jgi:hypothetical protein
MIAGGPELFGAQNPCACGQLYYECWTRRQEVPRQRQLQPLGDLTYLASIWLLRHTLWQTRIKSTFTIRQIAH